MAQLFDELQRRSVFRIGAAYLAVAWLFLQLIDVLKDLLNLPDWVGPYSFLALAAGFPIALILAWAFELIPEGTRSTEDAKPPEATERFGGRKIDFVIIGALSTVVILLVLKDTIQSPAPLDTGDPPQVRAYTQLTKSQVILPPTPSPFPLVADASRLYFNDWSLGTLGVLQVSQAGGEAVRVDSPFGNPDVLFLPHAMSPDRTSILVSSFVPGRYIEFKLWQLPVVGGAPRLLGDGTDATYSPDGSQILYTDGYADIYLANPDMSDARKLVTAPGKVHWPTFSPDGRRIRLVVYDDRGQQPAIWEILVDGSSLYRLLPQWKSTDHCCGSWTPDGRYYVFQATRDYRSQLWAIREADGKADGEQPEPIQITTGALDFRRPTIAADGRRIFAVGWQLRGELVRFDRETKGFVTLPGFESTSAEWLSYSGDGERVAFVSYPEADLWRSHVDGSNRVQLTFPPMQVAEPGWSPDGQILAFSGKLPEQPWQVYLISSDGGIPQPISPDNRPGRSPTWSPDSRYLAFDRAGHERIQVFEIATRTIAEFAGSDDLTWPRWSPDGRHIAAYSEGSLYLFDIESESRQLLVEDLPIEGFYWDSDSQHIHFVDPFWVTVDRSVYRFDIRSKTIEKVATVGGVRPAWGVWNMWVGVARDGAPLLLRDLSIHHIYALDWLP